MISGVSIRIVHAELQLYFTLASVARDHGLIYRKANFVMTTV